MSYLGTLVLVDSLHKQKRVKADNYITKQTKQYTGYNNHMRWRGRKTYTEEFGILYDENLVVREFYALIKKFKFVHWIFSCQSIGKDQESSQKYTSYIALGKKLYPAGNDYKIEKGIRSKTETAIFNVNTTIYNYLRVDISNSNALRYTYVIIL